MALVPDPLMGEGVIRLFPVRRNVFPGEEDADCLRGVAKMLAIADIAVKQEIRLLIDLQIEMTLQHPKRKPRIFCAGLRADATECRPADVDRGHGWGVFSEAVKQ